MKSKFVLLCVILALAAGCGTPQTTGQALQLAAETAPILADSLDTVYAKLLEAKKVPDNRVEATKALASLDAIAQMVHAEGANLAGDKFNWASFVVNAAITAAKVMGYWS